ncbi:MAG TPA: hypothetical protein VLM41_03935 [Steroidobacteraceae bacterium]|nr:hypothetical protein [Steroidobacteraceae bacterium]
MIRTAALAIIALLAATPARAALEYAADDGFLVRHDYSIAASTERAWAALVHPERWWPEDHTWSGNRVNLTLAPQAGGCLCERWPEGSAEHARVVMARPGKLLRLRGALGPLQEFALTGVLTVSLSATEEGSRATVSYRVSGDDHAGLGQFARVVDEVIGAQFAAFALHASQTRP